MHPLSEAFIYNFQADYRKPIDKRLFMGGELSEGIGLIRTKFV